MIIASNILFGICGVFGTILAWHALAPTSLCWLQQDQIGAGIAVMFLCIFSAAVLRINV